MEKLLESVLLVDDDSDVVKALGRLVESAGFSVKLALNANMALGMLENEKIFLAIVDLIMPGMGGLELSREIRKRWPKLPIVIVSGFADKDMAVEGLRLGVNDILDKPVDSFEFQSLIRNFAGERASELQADLDEITSVFPAS